ncbi:hypothetical protein EJ02DRAFT_348606 [Clathrospora elynae]|uniref:Peptidase A1 domain-containing protein n=1 Tax=Clathrospora elynae TaxID=706981 RepID=A0A6A5SR34_9PLEO|nr:hypothetical protein EJ02DRAFT_348606 [Clathrospora elynae]
MFPNIIFAALPLLARATYLDDSLLQKPLQDSRPHSRPERVVPLTLDSHLHYTFPSLSSSDNTTPLPFELIQDLRTWSSEFCLDTINIPLDLSVPGTITYTYSSPDSAPAPLTRPKITSHMSWVTSRSWKLGERIPLGTVGVRKGGMIAMEAQAARLDLRTPFIYVPTGIWDVLVQAARPERLPVDREEDTVVDCESKGVFPDIVFGLNEDGEEKEYAENVDELVVRPEQYVVETAEGKCVLLVRNAESCDDGEIVLGWAAIRGREFVLDWTKGRIGFGR